MTEGRPLAGVRVADFTWALAGPYGTKLLADMGAEVIKVETRAPLDNLRNIPPFRDGVRDPNATGWFSWYNRNKLSCTLNLKTRAGAELARRLVRLCDIAWDNFTPRIMGSFGLDYATLTREHPELIVVAQSGFGANGPYRDYPTYAEHTCAFAGVTALTGRADGPTVTDVSATADVATGASAAFSVLAALHHREVTGRGQLIEVSQHETMVGSIAEALLAASMTGRNAERQGNRSSHYAPQGVYPCQDKGWVALSVENASQWTTLARLVGRPEWGADARLAEAGARRALHDEIDQAISTWSRGRGHLEAQRALRGAGVTAGASLTAADLVRDEHLAARGYFQPVDDPAFGQISICGPAWKLSDGPTEIFRPAPRLGEHNQYVLCELLGLSSRELRGLEREGVVA